MKNLLEDLIKRVKNTAAKIPRSSKIIKGSPVYLYRKCGKLGCKCVDGEKHKSLYLSRSVNGKTQMIYIAPHQEKEILNCINKFKEIIGLLDEISELNLQIIKIKRSKNNNKK